MTNAGAPRLRVGLHVSQLIQPIPGGIGRVTQMLCDELPKYADVVGFAVGSRRARGELEARLGPSVSLQSVRSLPSFRGQYEVWRHLRRPRVNLNLDVCHAPSLAVPPSDAPLVVSINDVAFLRHPEAFTPHGLRFHKNGLAIARREAAVIIVPSEFTREELIREGFEPARIRCVPLAVHPGPTQPRSDVPDVLFRLGVRTPYVLTVGTIEPRKDHATIVAAFERARRHHPSLSLVIAGRTGWMSNPATTRLSQPGTTLLGHVNDSDLDVLYRNAHAVVTASIYEGFNLTVLEALTRGCPVIASMIPAHRELAGDAARYFRPHDVDMVADNIEELLHDRDMRARLAQAGQRRAERYDVNAAVRGHLAAYEQAAFGPRLTGGLRPRKTAC
jgi:glycosyltransferase involved in cell wall biosynthesis